MITRASAPLAVVRARQLKMGSRAVVKPFAILSTHTIVMGESAHVAPTAIILGSVSLAKSRLVIGDHSRIFPFCWLEPGEGIEIGKHVGIGGHALIFTHGAWSNYLQGGPVAYAPVTIEDGVWLPWRITVLAGVTIGANSIVMSGSVVTRSVPANVIAGGLPAKIIKESGEPGLDTDTRTVRAREIVDAFHQWHEAEYGYALTHRIGLDSANDLADKDVLFAVSRASQPADIEVLLSRGVSVVDHATLTLHRAPGHQPVVDDFTEFLNRYGIRLYMR